MSSVSRVAQDWVILLRRSEHTSSNLLARGTARDTLREEIPGVKLGRFLTVKDGDEKANFGLSC